MASYAHRPAPSGLHARLLREARELSPCTIGRCPGGAPNWITVRGPGYEWVGHRDLMPSVCRGAHDPYNLLGRPASD